MSIIGRIKKKSLITAVFVVSILTGFSMSAQDAPSVQDGEALFKANCASCHAVKEKVVGPALKGIETRRPEEWLIKWIKKLITGLTYSKA